MAKFNEEEKKFIIRSFARNSSAEHVRREFFKAFKIQSGRKRSHYQGKDFVRVNEHFEKNGSINKTPIKRPKRKRSDENVGKIKEMLEENKSLSIRQWSPQVSLSATTVWRILRFDLSAKFYRPSTVQPLSESHVEQRKNFCTWLLQQPACFVQNVIWTDEKIFVLNQRPNRKNDGVWSKVNPHQIVETNDRNGKKVMMFVAIVDGQIPIVHAFVDENCSNQSVNGASYLNLLQDVVWPALRFKATRKGYWWQQDGAPPHCTTLAKEFLLKKFSGRVISRGTPISWPAHSPDLNPLDFHFWGEAQRHVYQEQPESIEDLIQCVKTFAATYATSIIRKVADNVLKRAALCLNNNGGHFQHLLK